MVSNPRKVVDKQVAFERMKYLDFKERTGLNYKALVRKHEEAVKAVEDNKASKEGPFFPHSIMAIDPRHYAYLTEIVLEYLALGAEISQEVKDPPYEYQGEDL